MPNGLMDSERIREIVRSSKDDLHIIYQNDTKLVLKVHSDPAIEVKVEDEVTTPSVDIVEPERLGQLVQQFRDLMSKLGDESDKMIGNALSALKTFGVAAVPS